MRAMQRKKATEQKKGFSLIVKSFSEGTDRIANVIVEDKRKHKGIKAKKLKTELAFVAKDIASSINESLKALKVKENLCRAAYETGKFFGGQKINAN